MRIISGSHKGRRISPPAKMPYTRPTTDIAKEGLFNIIQNNLDITSLETLDLFGGTGCISYELASRGAERLIIIEKDAAMHEFIKKTAAALSFDNIKVIKMDVFKYLEHCTEKYDLVFAGPPYALPNMDALPVIIFKKQILNDNGWFIIEHTPAHSYKKLPFYRTERNYGTTIFSIFVNSK
ncbi:16S rRNA (guanine(966)-N(2))-methyltransferase RsmD [soil metagenome]